MFLIKRMKPLLPIVWLYPKKDWKYAPWGWELVNPSYLTQSWYSKIFAGRGKEGGEGGRRRGLPNRGPGLNLKVGVKNTKQWNLQGCREEVRPSENLHP